VTFLKVTLTSSFAFIELISGFSKKKPTTLWRGIVGFFFEAALIFYLTVIINQTIKISKTLSRRQIRLSIIKYPPLYAVKEDQTLQTMTD